MDFDGAALNFFFLMLRNGHRINAAIMSRPRALSFSGAEWRSGLAWTGLDAGLLRDVWRVCRKTASPFDSQQFCTIKLAEAIRAQSPIEDFASVG